MASSSPISRSSPIATAASAAHAESNSTIPMSITLYPNLILDALRRVRYPGTGQDLVTAGMVEDDIRIEG